jgi:4-hydroxy-2-oxoheptanedioate aldolase
VARVNRAVELLAQGQPIYYTGAESHDYEGGKKASQTWADFVNFEMEHGSFDVTRLREFMRGLVDGGQTKSGHRTPAVVVTLPMDAINEDVMRANSWVIKQILASGVHGLLLCHAESPDAVRAFVETCRYPFNTIGVGKGVQVGRRGGGGQAHAAEVWGVPTPEYLKIADPWPLNPTGELLLGLKIENVRALSNVEASLRVPGIAFAEWGPGDMGMSLGHSDAHDPPYPPEMIDARARVLAACKANNIAFLNAAGTEDVIEQITDGATVIATGRGGPQVAEIGRKHTKRTMPV